MSAKITRDMTFHQILQLDTRVAGVLGDFNLGCVGCMGAMNETLEQGAMAHGIEKLNMVASSQKQVRTSLGQVIRANCHVIGAGWIMGSKSGGRGMGDIRGRHQTNTLPFTLRTFKSFA